MNRLEHQDNSKFLPPCRAVEYRSEVIFMSDSDPIDLAFGDYFVFTRNQDDETQVFLQLEEQQVQPCHRGAMICIPMDLWLVMHCAGVPSFER
jgi:hypothetical protein